MRWRVGTSSFSFFLRCCCCTPKNLGRCTRTMERRHCFFFSLFIQGGWGRRGKGRRVRAASACLSFDKRLHSRSRPTSTGVSSVEMEEEGGKQLLLLARSFFYSFQSPPLPPPHLLPVISLSLFSPPPPPPPPVVVVIKTDARLRTRPHTSQLIPAIIRKTDRAMLCSALLCSLPHT